MRRFIRILSGALAVPLPDLRVTVGAQMNGSAANLNPLVRE